MYEQILLNQVRTPDGQILTSYHRHDYVTYVDKNGFEYMVDGGTAYLRRNIVDKAPYEELSVYLSDDHEENRKAFHWGTYGKHGDQPKHFLPLGRLTYNHIEAILETQDHISPWVRDLFKTELDYRNEIKSL